MTTETEKPIYTHKDSEGMVWRFEGSRPISKLADEVMAEVFSEKEQENGKNNGLVIW